MSENERKAAREANAASVNRLQTQNVLVNLQEALASGAANIEQIEKRRGALLAKIKNLKESENQIDINTLAAAEAEFIQVDKNAQAQLAILNARKEIRKTFSAEISAAGQLSKLFIENAEGRLELVKSEKEARPAQIAFATKLFEIGKADLERRREGQVLSGIEAQRAQAAADAQAALTGNLVKSITAARELADTFDKITKSQEKATMAADQQLKIEEARAAIAKSNARAASIAAAANREVAALKRQERLNKLLKEGANLQMQGQRAALRDALSSTPFLSENRANQIELILRREELKELEDAQKAQIEALETARSAQETAIIKQMNEIGSQLGKSFEIDDDGNLRATLVEITDAKGTLGAQFAAQLKLEEDTINAKKDEKLLRLGN